MLEAATSGTTSGGGPKPLISVVVPTLNEAENIERTYQRIRETFDGIAESVDWELVITDNRSSDDTFEIVERLARDDDRVRGYRFSRNVGFQCSILTAYLLAKGDAVVQIDADLQDPPELIPEFIRHWSDGADVVYGVRRARPGDGRATHASRKLYYRLVDWLSDDPLPHDAGDFRLIDRSVVEVLRYTDDATPYLRGAIASMGFRQLGVEYDRSDRTAGESKFSLSSLVRLGTTGIVNHSTRPLQMAGYLAVLVTGLAIFGGFGYAVARLTFGGDWPAGFVTVVLVQLLSIAINAVFFAVIGAYVGQIFRQSKPRPLAVIDRSTATDGRFALTFSQSARLEGVVDVPTHTLPPTGPTQRRSASSLLESEIPRLRGERPESH